MFDMAWHDNVALRGYNAEIMSTSDDKRQKVANSYDKNVWIPASAGMATLVGGNSH